MYAVWRMCMAGMSEYVGKGWFLVKYLIACEDLSYLVHMNHTNIGPVEHGVLGDEHGAACISVTIVAVTTKARQV